MVERLHKIFLFWAYFPINLVDRTAFSSFVLELASSWGSVTCTTAAESVVSAFLFLTHSLIFVLSISVFLCRSHTLTLSPSFPVALIVSHWTFAAFQQLHCSKTDDLGATGMRGCVVVFTSHLFVCGIVFFHPYIKQIHSYYSLCSKRLYRSRRRFNFLIKNNILPLYIVIITEREVQFHHKESIIIIIIIIIVGSGCCRCYHFWRSGFVFFLIPYFSSPSVFLSISLLFVCFLFVSHFFLLLLLLLHIYILFFCFLAHFL